MNIRDLAKLLVLSCFCALLFGAVQPALAQSRMTASAATTGMPRETGNNESYRLGTGDKIKDHVASLPVRAFLARRSLLELAGTGRISLDVFRGFPPGNLVASEGFLARILSA